MTRHYPDLGSASDWSCRSWNLPPPIRSTIQIWVVTRHQWEFLRSFLRRHFAGKPVLASRIVVCFLRLWLNEIWKSCFMLKRMKIDDYTLNINWATGQAYRGGRERRNKEENEHFTSSPLYLRRLSNARYNISTQLFWVWTLGLRSNGINWDSLSLSIITLKWLTDWTWGMNVLMKKKSWFCYWLLFSSPVKTKNL